MVGDAPQVVRVDSVVMLRRQPIYMCMTPSTRCTLAGIVSSLSIDSRLITWMCLLGNSFSMKKVYVMYDHRSHIRLLSRCEKTTTKVLASRPINSKQSCCPPLVV